MTSLRHARDAEPAQWLLDNEVGWRDLVTYGPPGFEAYVRIELDHGQVGAGEAPALRSTLAVLANYTATPEVGYAAVWEGWDSRAPVPDAPIVAIPNRVMVLFTGPVSVLRDAPALGWYGSAEGIYTEPHMVWPDDRAWLLACDVDEELECTVGCSVDAARALDHALPGAVRSVKYGERANLRRT